MDRINLHARTAMSDATPVCGSCKHKDKKWRSATSADRCKHGSTKSGEFAISDGDAKNALMKTAVGSPVRRNANWFRVTKRDPRRRSLGKSVLLIQFSDFSAICFTASRSQFSRDSSNRLAKHFPVDVLPPILISVRIQSCWG